MWVCSINPGRMELIFRFDCHNDISCVACYRLKRCVAGTRASRTCFVPEARSDFGKQQYHVTLVSLGWVFFSHICPLPTWRLGAFHKEIVWANNNWIISDRSSLVFESSEWCTLHIKLCLLSNRQQQSVTWSVCDWHFRLWVDLLLLWKYCPCWQCCCMIQKITLESVCTPLLSILPVQSKAFIPTDY